MTIGSALASGRERLEHCGDDGRFDALRLLEETLECNAAWIFAHGDDAIDADRFARYRAALERRASGEPVAYIFGSAGFYGRTFAVTPDVLVPRPETEMLVELARAAMVESAVAAPRVCDIGTGSGILAVTLACEVPDAHVVAIDVSPAALAVARRNAIALGVAERIDFRRGDAAVVLAGAGPNFDCIVANLPYVRSADLAARAANLAFEPAVALDGGRDGLQCYARLLAVFRACIAPDGLVLLEAGSDTTEPLARLAAERFTDATCVHVHADYAGHTRVVDVRFGRDAPRREVFLGAPKASSP